MKQITRKPEAQVDSLFINRWSPRAFLNTPISDDQIASLLEAARWAPSCFNDQPWLFCVGKTNEGHQKVLSTLAEANQIWAKHAPVLMILFARKHFAHNHKPNEWAVFDCGSAWVSLALRAHQMGLAAHGMAGFDQDKAYEVLGVSKENYKAVCAIAIGAENPSKDLLPENLREREVPSPRRSLKEIAIHL